MLAAAVVITAELVMYHVMVNPVEETDTSLFVLFAFIINVFVVCAAINNSIKDEEHPENEPTIKYMIIGSFFIRICIVLWDVYARHIYILPNSEGDAVWYHQIGLSFAFGSRVNEVNYGHYQYYVGLFYRFVGEQKLTVQFIHVFLAICSIVLIYKILCMFKLDAKIKKRAMIFACFLPNLMMITSFFLQESVIAFFIILSLYFYSKWWFGGGTINIVFCILSSIAGARLHIGGIVTAVGVLATLFLVNDKKREFGITTARLVAVAVVIFATLAAISMFGGDFLRKMGGEISAESMTENVEVKEYGGSAYTIGISGLSPIADLIVNTPIRMFYFMFSPLPWRWRGINDVLAFTLSTTFYIYVIMKVWKTYRSKATKELQGDNITSFMFVLVVIVLIAAVMFGWGVANAGTVIRHREKFTYICIVLLAISEEIMLRRGALDDEKENISDSSRLQRREVS